MTMVLYRAISSSFIERMIGHLQVKIAVWCATMIYS